MSTFLQMIVFAFACVMFIFLSTLSCIVFACRRWVKHGRPTEHAVFHGAGDHPCFWCGMWWGFLNNHPEVKERL